MAIYLPFKVIYNNQSLEDLGCFVTSYDMKQPIDNYENPLAEEISNNTIEIVVTTKQYQFNFKDGFLVSNTFPFKNITCFYCESSIVEITFRSQCSINYEEHTITLLDNK